MNKYLLLIISFLFIPHTSTNNDLQNIYALDTCNIPEEFSYITQDEFNHRYAGEGNLAQPVVFRQMPINRRFLQMMQMDSILNRYGNKYITVTTANTHSYKKRSIKLQDYINLQSKSSATIPKWGK